MIIKVFNKFLTIRLRCLRNLKFNLLAKSGRVKLIDNSTECRIKHTIIDVVLEMNEWRPKSDVLQSQELVSYPDERLQKQIKTGFKK